jgi:hypothetical protein
MPKLALIPSFSDDKHLFHLTSWLSLVNDGETLIAHRNGPRIDPWIVPDLRLKYNEHLPLMLTEKILSDN